MRYLAISVGLSTFLSTACAQEPAPASMSSLPVSIREALIGLCSPCEFADSDQPWNPTDVLDGRPRRHLTKVEDRGSSWLIEYDHGGIGTHTHAVVFVLEPSIHIGAGSTCVPGEGRDCEW